MDYLLPSDDSFELMFLMGPILGLFSLFGYLAWVVKIGLFLIRSLEYIVFTKIYRRKLPFIGDFQAKRMAKAEKNIMSHWQWDSIKAVLSRNKFHLALILGVFLAASIEITPVWRLILTGFVLFIYWPSFRFRPARPNKIDPDRRGKKTKKAVIIPVFLVSLVFWLWIGLVFYGEDTRQTCRDPIGRWHQESWTCLCRDCENLDQRINSDWRLPEE